MKINLRRLVGALLVVLGYALAVTIGPKLSDEYAQLGVTVAGAVGIVAGIMLILRSRKPKTDTPQI
jgi:hypothetical protein